MKKYITITTIQRAKEPGVRETKTTDGKRAVMETIKPGQVFEPRDDDEITELLSARAIRLATTDELKLARSLDDEGEVVVGTERAIVPGEAATLVGGKDTPSKGKREVSKTRGSKAPGSNPSNPDGSKPEAQSRELTGAETIPGGQGTDTAAGGQGDDTAAGGDGSELV
jgi:Ca2+-binding RTX toxin-like protein